MPVRDAAAPVLQARQALQGLPVPQVPQVLAAEAGQLFARTMRVRAVPTG